MLGSVYSADAVGLDIRTRMRKSLLVGLITVISMGVGCALRRKLVQPWNFDPAPCDGSRMGLRGAGCAFFNQNFFIWSPKICAAALILGDLE
jgi:hypothetical protein